jgi:hypothetical protein
MLKKVGPSRRKAERALNEAGKSGEIGRKTVSRLAKAH